MIHINHQISTLTMATPIGRKAGLSWQWAPTDQWVCLYRPRRRYLQWQPYHHHEPRHFDQPCDNLPVCRERASLPRTWACRRWRGISMVLSLSKVQIKNLLHQREMRQVIIMSPFVSLFLVTTFNSLCTTRRSQLQQLSSLSSPQSQFLDKGITSFQHI
jgi:hypothetical protein